MFSSIRSVCNPQRLAVMRIPMAQMAAKPAAAAPASTAVGKKRFRMNTETDPQKLMKTVAGANYYKEGEDVQVKEDSEYPEWLWDLPLKPKKLHEYDPETKEYWQMAETVGRQRWWKLRSITKENEMITSPVMIAKLELRHRRRFRALAKYHYNAGYDVIEHTQREDEWNLHKKDRYKVPESDKPFYPGIDKVNLPHSVAKMNCIRKDQKKWGHFGL